MHLNAFRIVNHLSFSKKKFLIRLTHSELLFKKKNTTKTPLKYEKLIRGRKEKSTENKSKSEKPLTENESPRRMYSDRQKGKKARIWERLENPWRRFQRPRVSTNRTSLTPGVAMRTALVLHFLRQPRQKKTKQFFFPSRNRISARYQTLKPFKLDELVLNRYGTIRK